MLEFNTLVKPLCMAINSGERVQAAVFTTHQSEYVIDFYSTTHILM